MHVYETTEMSCHDVENDAHAPDVGHLWNVRLTHQYFGRGVRVAAAVRLAALELSVLREHVGARESEVDQLDVVLLSCNKMTFRCMLGT